MKCHFTSVFPSLQLSFYCNTLKHFFFFKVNMSSMCWPSVNRAPASAACTSGTPLSVGRRGPKLLPSHFYLLSVKRASLLPTRSQHVFSDLFVALRRTLVPRVSEQGGYGSLRPPGGTAASYAREQLRRVFFFF